MDAIRPKRFWWVNQNQTFEHERRGGYLWSPKRNRNGARNQFYENMREVAPGDVVFSFRDTAIVAICVVQSYGYECPKPDEFGKVGANWEQIGWRVDVSYKLPTRRVVPKHHMDVLGPLLPDRYSPLQPNGNGLQSVYLASVPRPFAEVLAGLIGPDAQALVSASSSPAIGHPTQMAARGIEEWEAQLEQRLVADAHVPETERKAVIIARRGQGLFKSNVMKIESACRLTRVDNPAHLIGSHIKPWRDCATNEERLDGANGLLLTPSIDHLFDRGFISFKDNGDLLVSPVADQVSLRRMGVRADEALNVGSFSNAQAEFLEFHRDSVFLQATRIAG